MLRKNRQHWLRKMAIGLCVLLVFNMVSLPGFSLVDKVEANGSGTVTNNVYTLLASGLDSQNYELHISNDEVTGALLDGANIVINDYQPGDTLTLTADDAYGIGITAMGNGVYILSAAAPAPIEAYQAVLRGVRLSVTTPDKDRSITFTLGKALGYQGADHDTIHFYEFVSAANTDWFTAEEQAAQRSYFGRQGYLATITSGDENRFIAEKAQQDGWIGARDIERPAEVAAVSGATPSDGDWRWVTGPEGLEDGGAGRKFYQGYTSTFNALPVTDAGGEVFSNWDGGGNEPNDSDSTPGRGGEYVVHIYASRVGPGGIPGAWNDFHPDNTNTIAGYLVEYGGMPDDLGETISVTVNVADNLRLESITVYDETPGQATLDFNYNVDELELADFTGFKIDGRTVVQVLGINGDKVEVKLSGPLDPDSPLAASYDQADGSVTANNGANELYVPPATGKGETGDGITETNNIFPLKLVTAYVDGNQLKLVFNKPIDGDEADLDLAGLTFGGVPVEEPYAVDGRVLTVGLPAGAADHILAYNAGSGKIQDANNPNVKLGSIDPGIDLGDNQQSVDPDGRLNDLGISSGDTPIIWEPVFNSSIPHGYRAFLPEAVDYVELDPLAHPDGTIVHVEVNGAEVPAGQLPDIQLVEGLNTVTVSVYAEEPLTSDGKPRKLLGQYEILIYNGNPLITNITVQDATPDQATIDFSRALDAELTVEDFAGLTIDGRHIVEILAADGDRVTVRMDEPFAPRPEGKLAAAYVPAEGDGGVTASEGALELQVPAATGIDIPGDRITETNNIIPLELVTAYVDGSNLKLVFNKPIDGDAADLDLSGLAFGGIAVQEPYNVVGHLLTVRLPQGATSNVLTYAEDEPSNIQHANNPYNKLRNLLNPDNEDVLDPDHEAGLDLGDDRSFINPHATLVGDGPGLKNGGTPIAYSPTFVAGLPNGYRATVPYRVSRIQLDPAPSSPAGTIHKVTLNGQAVEDLTNLPLKIGMNTIQIHIYDEQHPELLLGQYEITVFRQSDSGGGGGGGSPAPQTIEVDVVIGGDKAADITKVPIARTTNNDGTISDQVTFTKEKAEETVEKAIEKGEKIARVVIPDPSDIVGEVKVDVPLETAKLLRENGIDLEIFTENAIVRLPNASMEGIEGAFYFRLVPVKDEQERDEIEERATVESVVREVAGDNRIEVVARPMTIETNLSSRPVTLILPLKDVRLPENAVEREAFLSQLGIFIEHTDGEKRVVKGKPVTYSNGLLGLEFSVTKFSTFTIIDFNNDKSGRHQSYIVGFPDGEFKPDENVTRAQMAIMIARNLGYNANAPIDRVPFEDVAVEHYSARAIAFVEARGIMNGDPDGRFRADEAITRAEMAAVVSNYLSLNAAEIGEASFEDAEGHWAQAIIEANVAEDIIKGYPDGSFKPNNYLTRAEAVVMINQMFGRGPLYGVSSSLFPDVAASHWAYEHIQEAARNHDYLIDEDGKEQFIQ